jgi:phosphoglycolate phosphatase
MLNHIMDDLGVIPERTLMIGDTTHDLNLAANAGAKSLAVTCGAHEIDQLMAVESLAYLQSFDEVIEWLKKNG